ncbi:MAG: hypothetical protein E7369_02955 [Clostridiales bacterium]|nr:hypothetical protein [Clostridiales bacterium]
MRLTKILSILIAVCLLFFTLSGGSKKEYVEYSNAHVLNNLDDYPIIKDEYADEIELKIMGSSSGTIDVDWKNNKFFKRMEDLTGVKFNFDNIFLEDMYKQKKGLVFTSEDSMPDIFFKAFFNNYDEITYGSNKQIRPLNQLIKDYAPNIQKLLDENPIIRRCITTTDGNIYALPTMYLNTPNDSVMRAFWWINLQWLKDVGETDGSGDPIIPTTIADLERVLTKFKEQKCFSNFSSPLVICGPSELFNLFPIFGLDISQYYVQADENGELVFGPLTENFEVAINTFKRFYENGLINQDWNTFTETKKYQYGKDDAYGLYQSASPVYVSGANNLQKFVTIDPLTSSVNSEPFWSATYPLERGCFAITSKCQYPEVAIRWIDTLYDTSKPYWVWAINGKENAEWHWNDPEKTSWQSDVDDAEYAEVMGTTIVQPGDGMPYAVDETFFDKETTNNASYVRPQRNRQMEYGKVSFPMVYFSKEELKELGGLSSDIDTYVKQYIAKTINGEAFDSYEVFSNKLRNEYGLDKYMSILQKAYDNFYGL